jgi:glycosyltransferase involved in cell wall biosynthesis
MIKRLDPEEVGLFGTGKTIVMSEFSDCRFDARVNKVANTLARVGFRVVLFMYNAANSYYETEARGRVILQTFPFPNRRFNKTQIEKLHRKITMIHFLLWMNLKVAFTKGDIIHAHNLYALATSSIVAWCRGIPLVYDAHELHGYERVHKGIKGRIRQFLVKRYERFFARPTKIRFTSDTEFARFIAERQGIKPPYVLHNNPPYSPAYPDGSLQKEANLKGNEKIIYFCGGVFESKTRRIDLIIEVLPLLPDEYVFIVVGLMNNSIRDDLLEHARKHGVEKRFYILPERQTPELIRAAACSDVGVIPFYGEIEHHQMQTANKLAEYLMAGLPIVATNFPVLKASIEDDPSGQVGKAFDINSAQSIRDAIQYVVENREILSNNARRLARERYNWENEESVLIEAYKTILKK